ncbi:MAG: hypothetical protein ACRDHO_07390, partial [Actinomycetota bacterium]
MFAVPGSAPAAGVQASLLAVFLLALGWLLVDALVGGRLPDPLARAGLAFAGAGLYAMGLTLAHMVTGGLVPVPSVGGPGHHERPLRRAAAPPLPAGQERSVGGGPLSAVDGGRPAFVLGRG